MEIGKSENNQIISLDSLLEILGNPTRRAILNKLAKFPHSAPELASALGISRQAVHSQLTLLQEKNIIEPLEASEIRGDKYRIKSNISVNIDITPDYYNIKYDTTTSDTESELVEFKDMNCSINYSKIKSPNDKVRFLSDEIRKIEKNMIDLESKRKGFLNQKECLILEIKGLMRGQFKEKLEKLLKDKYEGNIKDKNLRASLNLTEEILTTMFFNPERYFNRFNINRLMEDLFFSDMDKYERDRRFGSIRPILEEISRLMGFFHEDDDWFFDF
ncbi:MAG: ArsR/SmtB family transcription factor [Candidatus Hodarchaeota archaeon]